MSSPLGFIGLGAMGEPMAATLRRAGFDVVGFDVRTEVLAHAAREHGVRPAASAYDVACQCTTVITMLPTSEHVERVLFGDGKMASGLARGSLMIDMSSGEPSVTRRLGQALWATADVDMVDAPVSGNVTRARQGDLAIMLGGRDEACDRAAPVLEPLARAVYRTGPLGSGQAMKALNNLASAAGFWITSEVLTIGKKAGLDPDVMLNVLNASTGSNNSTQNKFKPFVLSGSYAGNFLLQLMVKDLGIACGLVSDAGAHAPLAMEVLALWQQALDALGPTADHTEVARYVAKMSGAKLDSSSAHKTQE